MKARYTSTKCMISIIAALILAATAAKGAGGLIWEFEENTDQPPEIRIMSRIIQTALSGVEAPELPEQITEKGEERGFAYTLLGEKYRGVFDIVAGLPPGPISVYSGSRKVSGFYMNGYGYLFTIRWPIRSSSLISSFYRGGSENLVLQLQAQNEVLEQLLIQRSDVLRRRAETAAGAGEEQREAEAEVEAEQEREKEELQRQREELAGKIEEWRTEFENRLVETLKDVMATYGHTLHRAAPDESITFILEQSEDEEDNITLSVKRAELGGPTEKERALRAIRVSRGSAETNPALKSQVRIMAEIIDAAFEYEEEEEGHLYVLTGGAYFGGEARTQYIPGYGVIFRKNARMNPLSIITELTRPDEVTAEERVSTGARRLTAYISGTTAESREKMEQHLEMLKKKTAEILATYGTTLTELEDDEWVGINYDVGSAASLLQSGVSNYLVLAQMSRVREAARQGGNAADWLLEHLVTNEKPEF